MDLNQLDKLIKSIGKRAGILKDDIQRACFAATEHRAMHGDNTRMTNLVLALGTGHRAKSVIEYLEHFGGVAWRTTNKSGKKTSAFKNTDTPILLEQMVDMPWHVFAPEHDKPAFDFEKAIARLERLVKDVDKALSQGTIKPADKARLGTIIDFSKIKAA